MSWSSRYVPLDQRWTRTARTFWPGRSTDPTSNSYGSRLPLKCPSSVPLSQTFAHESTPRKRSTDPPCRHSGGRSNTSRWSPVGFSVGTFGGSSGIGSAVFV